MTSSTTTILNELSRVERQVQRLKIRAYFALPKERQADVQYPQEFITKALKRTRTDIWNEKYAKKVKSLS